MPEAAGVFLLSLSGLTFEIALTRIFSATLRYHFAFVAISTALLGWGLGGLLLHVLRGRIRSSREFAARLALLYAASVPCSLWVIVRVPAQPERIGLAFAAALWPFLLAG